MTEPYPDSRRRAQHLAPEECLSRPYIIYEKQYKTNYIRNMALGMLLLIRDFSNPGSETKGWFDKVI
ncbi:MAG: hypothetical protein H6540_04870 [Bacteroidales bacterium]|nr:hypothetical protein [Bacteroidales bacterium]